MNPSVLSEISLRADAHRYDIVIGQHLAADPARYILDNQGDQFLVVSDTNIAPGHLQKVVDALGPREIQTLVLTPGEEQKTLTNYSHIIDTLVQSKFRRNATLISLGGGVIGDMAGFAAASYMRGINWIQVPTTTLSQIDASVGGKTAVNHSKGKNLIGAFYQPNRVIIDLETLATLPQREFLAGIAEALKAAIIDSEEFFNWIESNTQPIKERSTRHLGELVERSCKIKAHIVEQDERERGIRIWLNLGHTFAHALETISGYDRWLHGEAVAIGVCLEAELAVSEGLLDESAHQRIVSVTRQLGLPYQLPEELSASTMAELMRLDKKNLDEQIRLVLPIKIGKVKTVSMPMTEIQKAFKS